MARKRQEEKVNMTDDKWIAVDMDGVIFEQGEWCDRKRFGRLIPDAISSLQSLKNDGWKIIIHTARHPDDHDFIEAELNRLDIPFDKLWRGVGKPLADIYLDDRCITFKGNWRAALKDIAAFKPWFGVKFLRPTPGSDWEELIKDRR